MSYELDLNKIETEYNDVLLKVEENEKDLIVLNEQLKQKQDYLSLLNNNYKNKDEELNGTKSVSNKSLDKELDKILKDFYNAQAEKEKLEKELNKLKDERSDMALEIADMEREFREVNSIMNQKQNELKNEEIKAGKMDVKLDNLLLSLNENYGLTFERARDEYSLDVDVEVARVNVNNLKVKIRELGEVNTGSISEYERLNERYNFLTSQKEDLEKSVTELMSIIDEMDEIMKVKFVESFEKIKEEFNNVFKTLFKGGEGLLSLTNPDDLLNTGVDILAVPPGKKLNSIALLSGGEKTLTAIALLFAILNVKPVPFVVLDEVEAALDENNVDSFGRYLQSKKDKSQFIIITHKKRTMEFADTLYGVTMQESGVSKLVSVRLEDK
jgi:chromosome segregation protein